MKKMAGFILMMCFAAVAHAQTPGKNIAIDSSIIKARIVEASCGECNFGMKVPGCVLAVRIDGKAYLVDGAPSLNSYGDAHAEHGMCNTIRKAEVTGEIKNGRFVAQHFKLLPVAKK
jgi:hypothetical protein